MARPKRAAEDFVRTHGSEDGPSAKKPRFDIRNPSALAPDALEDDVTLEADEIGKRGQQVRRNAVNIDGYDSDSDNEAFDTRAEARAKDNAADKSKEGEQDDMFADLEEDFRDGDDNEGDNSRRGGRKKTVRFLDEDEIEGQISGSKSGGHVSADFTLNGKRKAKAKDNEVDSSSESDVDDETRAGVGSDVDQELGAGGKKSHTPKLDAFNMRNENQEGRFDEQGNYVRKAADPDTVYDSWLEGVSKKEIRKAKQAADKREEEQRQRNLADDAVLTKDVLGTLITNLERGETVLEALARLGRGKYQKPKWQNKNRNKRKATVGTIDTEMVEEGQDDPIETKRKAIVESITEAADQLLSRGQAEVYDQERELFVRQYRRDTGEDWVDPTSETGEEDIDQQKAGGKMWEYRWSDGRDGEIHGPYEGSMMVQWNEAGYFGEGVEFRRAGDVGEWSRVVDFV